MSKATRGAQLLRVRAVLPAASRRRRCGLKFDRRWSLVRASPAALALLEGDHCLEVETLDKAPVGVRVRDAVAPGQKPPGAARGKSQ